ncbi:MAG: hypothetical protein RI984_1920 [Pseudomonadota bacterium]
MVAMEELRAAANNSLAACSGMQSTKKNAHVNGRFYLQISGAGCRT